MPILFLTVLLDFVGFGIIIPMLPFFGLQFGATATEVTMLFAVYSAVQFFSGPFWGRLSDRIGRRPVLLLTLLGASLAYAAFGLATSLPMLFLARGLSGLMAGNMGVAHAIVADLTTPEGRAKGMGILGAATSLGFVFGPILGSLLLGPDPAAIDHSFPAFTAAALSAGAFVLGLFMLKESLPRKARAKRPTGGPSRFKVKRLVAKHRVIAVLVLQLMVLSYVVSQMTAIFPLWSQSRFGWGPKDISYLFALIGLFVAVIQGGMVGILTKNLGEARVLLIGASIEIAGLIAIVVADTPVAAALGCILTFAGSTMCSPVLTSLISRKTAPEHQGGMLGTANAAASLGRIVGPPFGGVAYEFLGHGSPFAVAALLVSMIVVQALRIIFETVRDGEIADS
ncbi:MAG: MFS transporter [Sphingomonadales bacterium]